MQFKDLVEFHRLLLKMAQTERLTHPWSISWKPRFEGHRGGYGHDSLSYDMDWTGDGSTRFEYAPSEFLRRYISIRESLEDWRNNGGEWPKARPPTRKPKGKPKGKPKSSKRAK